MPDNRFHNKVILLTGGAHTPGPMIAYHLFAEGAYPITLDRNRSKTTALVAVNNPAACARIVHLIYEHYGHIDAIINIAAQPTGTSHSGHFYHTTMAALPYLRISKGPIINLLPNNTAAGALKLHITRQWAFQYVHLGIPVHALLVNERMYEKCAKWTELKPIPSLLRRFKPKAFTSEPDTLLHLLTSLLTK
jgi:hypothetical protein